MKTAHTILFILIVNFALGQEERWSLTEESLNQLRQMDDSICQFGKKYDYPKRLFLDSLAVKVSDEYKIQEIHRALPKPSEEDTTEENLNRQAFYDFFFDGFGLKWTDEDTMNYGHFRTIEEFENYTEYDDYCYNYPYTLKDFYFFDFNGDNQLDFIQYPLFHNRTWYDHHFSLLFIQTENGYKELFIGGFIVDINFHKDGTLNEIKTFQPECCLSGRTYFYYYVFDKEENELTLVKKEKVLICQFNGEEPFSEF